MLHSFFGPINFFQIIMFFILVMVVVVVIMVLVKRSGSMQTPNQQKTMQREPVAHLRSLAVLDTFNPYRYFSPTPEAPSSDYLRSRDTRAFGRNLNTSGSTQNYILRSRQRQQLSPNDQTTPLTTIYRQTAPRMSLAESDGVALNSPIDESTQQLYLPKNPFITNNDDSHYFQKRRNQYDY